MASGIVTDAFLDDVRSAMPGLRLLVDPVDRESYRRDETAYLHPGLPGAVALPTTTAEVAGLVRICGRHDIPIVPRGAGSGLSGGANGIEGALTLALTGMDRILEIDTANLCVVTQPGVINATLKAAVAEHGLFYAPDPASFEICSIGGNLGTNAGGLCCVKYGQTREAVLGLEVVMADGTVIRTGGKNVKDVAGYSLTHLIVGSQGTLGIITEATLRLRPAPPPRATLLAFFPTLEGAGEAVAAITAAGLVPVTLELMDQFTIAAVDDMHDLGLDRTAAAMLMIESDMPGVAADDELVRAEAACVGAGATSTIRSQTPAEADMLRQARRMAHYALERLGDVKMEDIGVPRARVPDMLREVARIAARHGVRMGAFGHAGDGNLHPDLVLERGDPRNEAITKAIQDDLYQAALDLGGTVTGEHGIGSARTAWLEPQQGADAVRIMRSIKTALDPQGLLNPGASCHRPDRRSTPDDPLRRAEVSLFGPRSCTMRGHACTSVQYICASERGLRSVRRAMSDFEQLVQASRLYYELGETQNAIAERLGVTRPQVSRLLKRARAEGIVEIRIVDRTAAESPAADALRRSYGLDAVHLAPTVTGPEDLSRRMVGRLAAQVLRGAVRDGEIVGIGDGASVSAVADALEDGATPVAATVVPLAGGYWSPGPERDPFRRVADAFGALPHGLMAPGLLDDAATKRALEAHAGVQAVRDLWDHLDVVLYGIGGRSWGEAAVGAQIMERLGSAAAVGEVLIAPFDIDGAFVCPELRERVLAFDARALGRVPTSIGVASGESKVQPILGALRAGVVRTLVTDVATAEAVVALDATTLGARHD